MTKKEVKSKIIKKKSKKRVIIGISLLFVILIFVFLISWLNTKYGICGSKEKKFVTYNVKCIEDAKVQLLEDQKEKFKFSSAIADSEKSFYIVSNAAIALNIIESGYKFFKDNNIIAPSFYTSLFGNGYVLNTTLTSDKYSCDVELCDNNKLNITIDNNPWFEKTTYRTLTKDKQIYSMLKKQIIDENNPVLVYVEDSNKNIIGIPVIGATSKKASILYSDSDFITINIDKETKTLEVTTLYEYCKNNLETEKNSLIDKNKNSCNYTYQYQYNLK